MKLIRDGYEPGEGFTIRPAKDDKEHVLLLVQKFYEEFGELLKEENADGGVQEAGDLIEVVISYCQVRWNLTEEEVMQARKIKSDRLGGFMAGKVWVEG